MLDPMHKDLNRKEETRIKVQAQNKANQLRRFQLTMEAWTAHCSLCRVEDH